MEIREVDSRKEKKAKKHRNKSRAVIFAVCFLIIICLAFWIVTHAIDFPKEKIKVSGSSVYSAEEILDLTDMSVGDMIFGTNNKKINNTLVEKFPYIQSVEFKRTVLPEFGVQMIITEGTDVFCYKYDGFFLTADENNKILSKFTAQPDGTTLIKTSQKLKLSIGETANINEADFLNIATINSTMTKSGYSVGYIDITDNNSIKILIDNQFIVDFGASNNLEGKVAHLNGMIKEIIVKNGQNTTGRIDLSAWTNKNQRGYYEPSNIF